MYWAFAQRVRERRSRWADWPCSAGRHSPLRAWSCALGQAPGWPGLAP